MDKLKVLYEDNHVIAVFKPAGVPFQPDKGGKESLYDKVKSYLKKKYKKPGNVFLGIVQRLDQPVSGIALFGKTSKGASRLSEQIRERKIRKEYTALVSGKLSGEGIFFDKLVKEKEKNKVYAKQGGKESVLEYRVLKSGKEFSLVKINLKTGRPHQIRAQFALRHHPVAGDVKYGAKPLFRGEICLTATNTSFQAATTNKIINLSISVPEKWKKLV